jgi:hypothetical protein
MYLKLSRRKLGNIRKDKRRWQKEQMKLDTLKHRQNSQTSQTSSELFDQNEWKRIKELNRKTTDRIHDATLPKEKGKFFIVLPSAEFNDETVRFFKRIGVNFFIKFGVVKEASRISYHEWQQSIGVIWNKHWKKKEIEDKEKRL